MRNLFASMAVIFVIVFIIGCGATDAQVASKNLSQAADRFQIVRRVVFYNGITGDYMLSIIVRVPYKEFINMLKGDDNDSNG